MLYYLQLHNIGKTKLYLMLALKYMQEYTVQN